MSGGRSRVSIPSNVRVIIEEIKEFAGKHSDDDIHAMLEECNMDPNETAQKLLYLDTFHEVKRRRDRRTVNESSRAFEEYRWGPSMRWREARGGRRNYSSHVDDDARSGRNVNVRKENGVINPTDKGSTPFRPVLQKTGNNATPRAANSTLSANSSTKVSNRSATHGPVLQPHSSAGINRSASDLVSVTSTGQDVANSSQAASGVVKSSNETKLGISQGIESGQLSGTSQLPFLSTHKQQNAPSEVVVHVAVDKFESLPANNPVDAATLELDMKLEKLKISPTQSVIFPDHLQVPEAFKNQLTFGSLDGVFGAENSSPLVESGREIGKGAGEPSISNQSVSSIAQEGDSPAHPQAGHMPKNLSLLGDNVASGSVLNHDPSKEIRPSIGGPHFPLLQPGPNYSFSLVPPVAGSHAVQPEGPELQGGNSMVLSASGTTPPATQPVGVRQRSLAVPPHLFPLFRQPYLPNYISYNPYLPHIFMPQNAHQFLGYGFPQPPSTGNVYIPPAAAPSGVKFPFASLYKPGTNAGLTPLGIPSGYVSYGSSAVGFNLSAAVTPGSSAGPEELSASEPKEKNLFSVVQQLQGEDSLAWTPSAAGPDISSLQNYFYSLPQGQHIGFSPAQASHGTFAGIYHASQTMAAPPTVQPHLHQSRAMAGSIESVLPPSVAHQQPQHAQMNWNTPLLS